MESNKSKVNELIENTEAVNEELACLPKISAVDFNVSFSTDDLIICNASEVHIKEISELWANLAGIKQVIAPDKFSFTEENKNWQIFVRKKLARKNNLLLVAHEKNDTEIKSFLYLQTVTLPSSELILKGIIEDIYTKPQYRRQGIASELLDTTVKVALKNNIKNIDFITLENFREAFKFYLNFVKNMKESVKLELVFV